MMRYTIPFLDIGKKYNSGQNYVYNFAFPKMDDDLGGVKNPKI